MTTTTPNVTPLVRREADALGVDLATIVGTGVAGRIRKDDIYAAAGPTAVAALKRSRNQNTPPTPGPASPTSYLQPLAGLGARPRVIRNQASEWHPFERVDIDVFADNPLIDDLKQVSPTMYKSAVEVEPQVPNLFTVGPFPIFVASGFDPAMLARLPWFLRPALARCSSKSLVAEVFDRCGGGDLHAVNVAMAAFGSHKDLDHSGISEYRNRVEAWRWATPAPPEWGTVFVDHTTSGASPGSGSV